MDSSLSIRIERVGIESADMVFGSVMALLRERIDVTAPEGEGWARTRRFYEREGFTFAGPKLKLPLA